jgi:S1-C subfamily serine protease
MPAKRITATYDGRVALGSTVLDILLLVLLVAWAVYGFRRGFALSVGGILGVIVGAILAFFAIPFATSVVGTTSWRLPVILLVVVGLIVAGFVLGTALGRAARRGVAKGPLRSVDRIFGAVISLVATAIVISMLAFGIGSLGVPFVSDAITSSKVVATIDAVTPSPVKDLEAQVRAAVTQEGIPRLLDSIGAGTPLPIPASGSTAAQQQAGHSVVKITGNAYACGQNQTGSGFVVSPGRIITNAHVVAGVTEPVVLAPDGGSWTGRVVYFDPVNDLAVVAVSGMPTAALPIGETLKQGSTAVFDGYPLGGPFSSKPAAIEGVTSERVPDIYGGSPTAREVYSLAADVEQGNSGGPLLDAAGQVAGVVFAKSSTTADVGFALTTAELAPVAAQAASLSATVASGHCTSE